MLVNLQKNFLLKMQIAKREQSKNSINANLEFQQYINSILNIQYRSLPKRFISSLGWIDFFFRQKCFQPKLNFY